MKSIILVALALVAIAVAAPLEVVQPKIIEYKSEALPNGGYYFIYKTDDGSVRSEEGEVREVLDENNELQRVIVVKGFYTFLDAEGNPETINYYADESGYHADGKSIPKNV